MVSCALLQRPQRKCVMFSRSRFYQARFVSHKFQCFQLVVQFQCTLRRVNVSVIRLVFSSVYTRAHPQVLQSVQSSQALVRVQTKVRFYYFLVSIFFQYSFRFLSLVSLVFMFQCQFSSQYSVFQFAINCQFSAWRQGFID